MKKLLAVIAALFVIGGSTLFAQEEKSVPKHLFIGEATVGAIGFGVNEVFTYDFNFTDFFGLGAGIQATEGMIGTINGFIDFRLAKWNLGLGGGYSYMNNSENFLVRAVYHGNSWNWGPLKAGMTLGTDWQLSSASGDGQAAALVGIITMVPRFIIGINVQYGL